MKHTDRIAKQLRDLHFGNNWTAVSLKDKLADVTWQQATQRVHSLHSISTLVFHLNYYVSATIKVLQGGPLEAQDKLSFDGPSISSQQDWQRLLNKTWEEAEELASLIEGLPDSQLSETFVDENHGTYYRCLQGPIEHGYYHLGQIAIIKTILRHENQSSDR
ncbi:MAG: hypothetical protein MI861_20055 [Pirellulales bacterium]|nr:hypothetical protein [Pirellulales bacterium]